MRVAFLLHGIVGGMKGKGGEGKLIDYKYCRDRFYKNIIKPNDADVFIHSWSEEQEEDLMKIYSPKKAIFQKQKRFKEKKTPFRIKSRFYSTQVVMNLKRQYEKENNFRYDFVMVTRFDLLWYVRTHFKNLNPNYFYIGKWNNVNYSWRKASRVYNGHPLKSKLNDLFFFSNSKFMDYYGDAYDSADHIRGDPHKFLRGYLNRSKEIRSKKKFIYLKYFDHDVYRDRVESYENGVTILKEDFEVVRNIDMGHKRTRGW